eukprot:TRINITY_DN15772_c0_g1_i1.p4 TRINITY_DN15772_c0_g1~~TRINITY_DN15772_c0_g1_i1.p4  ORF type:complete len:109 (-),score=5.80 TRINITY_DN15772_c0_g1_i1:426-752(-)
MPAGAHPQTNWRNSDARQWSSRPASSTDTGHAADAAKPTGRWLTVRDEEAMEVGPAVEDTEWQCDHNGSSRQTSHPDGEQNDSTDASWPSFRLVVRARVKDRVARISP